MAEHYCCARVQTGGSRRPFSTRCNNRASLNEGGQWFCKRHAPSIKFAKRQKKEAALEQAIFTEERESDIRVALQPHRERVLDAVRRWAHGGAAKNVKILRTAQRLLEDAECILRGPQLDADHLFVLRRTLAYGWQESPFQTWVLDGHEYTQACIQELVESKHLRKLKEYDTWDVRGMSTPRKCYKYEVTEAGRDYLKAHGEKG